MATATVLFRWSIELTGLSRQLRLTDKGAFAEQSNPEILCLKTVCQQRSSHLSKKCVPTALSRLLSTVNIRLGRVQKIETQNKIAPTLRSTAA